MKRIDECPSCGQDVQVTIITIADAKNLRFIESIIIAECEKCDFRAIGPISKKEILSIVEERENAVKSRVDSEQCKIYY